MPDSMTMRFTGGTERVEALVQAIRGLADVDGVMEMDLDLPPAEDDSSSAGLPDDEASPHRDVRLNVASSVAYDYVHGRLEILAARAGVVLEWLDEE